MSDIDILMPTLLNQKSSSATITTSASLRTNQMPPRSFFLAQQAKSSTEEESSSSSAEVKVSWIDDSTEAERLRQHQLHNLDEMTQLDDDY